MRNIGLVFSSMDRYELTRVALTSLLSGVDSESFRVTLLWQDGSLEPNACKFFESFVSDRVTLLKHAGIRGIGAAGTIERGMRELSAMGEFDWIGIVESDVSLSSDWLKSVFRAHDAAVQAGYRPGILSPYVVHGWVVEYHTDFVTMSNVGAACSLFRPEVWRLVPPPALGHQFPLGIRVALGHPPGHTGDPLSMERKWTTWDWSFAASAHHGGFDSIGTPVTHLYNCDVPETDKRKILGFRYVEHGDEPMWRGTGPVTLGERNYAGWLSRLQAAAAQYRDASAEADILDRVKLALPKPVRRRLRALRAFVRGA